MRKSLSSEQWECVTNHYDYNNCISHHGSAGVYPRGDTKIVRISDWDNPYLDFAMELYDGSWSHLAGRHFPDIFSIHYQDDGSGSCVVVERLEELVDLGYDGLDELFGIYWNESLWLLESEIEEYCDEDERALITDSFKDAFQVMLDEARIRGWNPDIHGYNVMVRRTPGRNPLTGRFQRAFDELVIIDPWC